MSAGHLRDALRLMRRQPLHAFVVAATLALGVGSASAVYDVLHAVVLRPLPFPDSGRLMLIAESDQRSPGSRAIPAGNLADYRAGTTTANLEGFSYSEFVVAAEDGPERVIGAEVTGGLFDLLGVGAQVGRSIGAGDAGAANARVVVLSHALWQRRYGRDPTIVGRSIDIDGVARTVAGVMPERFEFPRNDRMAREVELWVPSSVEITPASSRERGFTVVARIRRGAMRERVQAELDAVAAQISASHPSTSAGLAIRVTELREHMIGRVQRLLVTLFAGVVLLLLIVCVNAAFATGTHALRQGRTVAVRMALGAGRARAVQPLLAEAVLLAVAGGLTGLGMVPALRTLMLRQVPASLPRMEQPGSGATVLFAIIATMVCAGICVATLAYRMRTTAPGDVLGSSQRSTGPTRSGRRIFAWLTIAQIGTATLLLAAGGATVLGVVSLDRIDPGFEAGTIVTASVSLTSQRYRPAAMRSALLDAFLERVRALPGVEQAATISILPLGAGIMSTGYTLPDQPAAPDMARQVPVRAVSDEYFATVKQHLLRGRTFGAADRAGGPATAVVNEYLARESFGASPIGKRLQLSGSMMVPGGSYEIVGVVADARELGVTDRGSPMVYISARQAPSRYTNLVVRGPAERSALVRGMRLALHDLDPTLALDEVATLRDRVRSGYALERLQLALLAWFGVMSVALVALGVYGEITSVITAQRRAIAVRLALGASPSLVCRHYLANVGWLLGLGVGAGMVATLWLLPAVRGLSTITQSHRAAGIGMAASILTLATLAATLRAIVRAARMHPAVALQATD